MRWVLVLHGEFTEMLNDLARSQGKPNWCLGELFTYEITAIDDKLVELAFLFVQLKTYAVSLTDHSPQNALFVEGTNTARIQCVSKS